MKDYKLTNEARLRVAHITSESPEFDTVKDLVEQLFDGGINLDIGKDWGITVNINNKASGLTELTVSVKMKDVCVDERQLDMFGGTQVSKISAIKLAHSE